MARVLVVQGSGMDERGKTMVEIFGPETLDEIDEGIRADARDIGIDVDIIQSNVAEVVVDAITAAAGIDGLIINPAGFTAAESGIPEAIEASGIPAIEVHASNPAARGVRSVIAPVCQGAVCGFGYFGYRLALMALAKNMS